MNNDESRPLSKSETIAAVRNLQHSDQTIAAFLAMLNKTDPGMFQTVVQKAKRRIEGIDWTSVPITDPKAFSAVTHYVGITALLARVNTDAIRTNDPDAEDPELLAKREYLSNLVKNTEIYLNDIKKEYVTKLEELKTLHEALEAEATENVQHQKNSFKLAGIIVGVVFGFGGMFGYILHNFIG